MSMFDGLDSEKVVKIPLKNGEELEITISTLSTRTVASVQGMKDTAKAAFKIVYESIKENHPDETLETVSKIPLYVIEPLLKEILEFNGIDASDLSSEE